MTSGRAHGAYRPDVDGLRAIAVLSVVAYHAKPLLVPGGWIGVDVFFVISGFLISGIILQGLNSGSFSFADFYARRVRRIFPALSLVLLVCLVAGWLFLLPREFVDLGGDVAAGAGFVANFRFWGQTGYFNHDIGGMVLLHLWSLGIEEQYYLVWPTVLLLLWRTRHRLLPIAAGLVGSLILSIYWSRADLRAAFFSPAARLWELALGSIIAYVTLTHGEPIPWLMRLGRGARESDPAAVGRVRTLCAWVGIAMIAVVLFAVRSTSILPGYWALLPTFGTALLICAGPDTWVNRALLSNRLMVGFGLISYPLYLWHWPALAFLRIKKPDAGGSLKLIAIAAAVVAAYLTYKLLERPIRRAGGGRAVAVLCVVQALLFAAGLLIVRERGFPDRGDAVRRRIFAVSVGTARMQESYLQGTCLLDMEQRAEELASSCYAAPAGAVRPHVLLWGDSFAAHLIPGMQQVFGDSMRLSFVTASLCAPIVDYVENRRLHCTEINQAAMKHIEETKPDVVVLSGRWNAYPEYADVGRTIVALKKLGVPRVVLVGSSAQFASDVPRLMLNALSRGPAPTRLPGFIMPKLATIDSALKDVADRSGAVFVTPMAEECTKAGCLVALDTAAIGLMTWDDGHLTATGSRYIVERVLKPALRP